MSSVFVSAEVVDGRIKEIVYQCGEEELHFDGIGHLCAENALLRRKLSKLRKRLRKQRGREVSGGDARVKVRRYKNPDDVFSDVVKFVNGWS